MKSLTQLSACHGWQICKHLTKYISSPQGACLWNRNKYSVLKNKILFYLNVEFSIKHELCTWPKISSTTGLLIVLKRKSKVRESSWGILKMPNCHKSVNYNQSERIFTRVSLKKSKIIIVLLIHFKTMASFVFNYQNYLNC